MLRASYSESDPRETSLDLDQREMTWRFVYSGVVRPPIRPNNFYAQPRGIHGRDHMSRSTIALILGLMLSPILSLTTQAQSAITEQEAQSIARDAYIYFYPLVTMDVTRKLLTNVEPGK